MLRAMLVAAYVDWQLPFIGVGRTMTTESDNGNESLGDFKPTGTVAFAAAFVAVMLLMWFSIYIILLSRGATI